MDIAVGLINVGLALLGGAAAGWLLAVGVPALARVRLQATAERLYAEVTDARREGSLPRGDESVSQFARACLYISRVPQAFGFTESLALHSTYERLGLPEPKIPSYDSLSLEQADEMRTRERLLVEALAHHLIWGSRVWPLIATYGALHRPFKVLSARGSREPVTTDELARDARRGAGITLPPTVSRKRLQLA